MLKDSEQYATEEASFADWRLANPPHDGLGEALPGRFGFCCRPTPDGGWGADGNPANNLRYLLEHPHQYSFSLEEYQLPIDTEQWTSWARACNVSASVVCAMLQLCIESGTLQQCNPEIHFHNMDFFLYSERHDPELQKLTTLSGVSSDLVALLGAGNPREARETIAFLYATGLMIPAMDSSELDGQEPYFQEGRFPRDNDLAPLFKLGHAVSIYSTIGAVLGWDCRSVLSARGTSVCTSTKVTHHDCFHCTTTVIRRVGDSDVQNHGK